MPYGDHPLFWALVSLFALCCAAAVVGTRRLGSRPLYGFAVVALFALGRLILPLPFCPQPRFDLGGWHSLLGGALFAAGLIFCLPALSIRPFTAPDGKVTLSTRGFYGIVRNPIYLGEVLWSLGWSILFRSAVGVALVPLWWAGLLIGTLIEEEHLERELGEPYRAYKRTVRGRIIPGLPI